MSITFDTDISITSGDEFARRASIYLARHGLGYEARVDALRRELELPDDAARRCALADGADLAESA